MCSARPAAFRSSKPAGPMPRPRSPKSSRSRLSSPIAASRPAPARAGAHPVHRDARRTGHAGASRASPRTAHSGFLIALPIAADDAAARLVARLRSALRIRSLHATVLRRAHAAERSWRFRRRPRSTCSTTRPCCASARGGSYPALSVAIGERVGLIGALSVETAARYLNGPRYRRHRHRRRAGPARRRGAPHRARRGRPLPRSAGRRAQQHCSR